MYYVYRYRDYVAMLPVAGLVFFLASAGLREIKPLVPKEQTPVKLEIIEVAPIAPPRPEPKTLAKPEPAPPRPQVAPPKHPTASSAPRPAAVTQPEERAPDPQPAAASAQPVVSAPAPVQSAPVPAPAPASKSAPAADAEAEFIARIRAYLNAVKRYPTGREASLQRPQGTVKVWFVLKRDGAVVDMGIEQSSNSPLLDQAARKSVSLGSFPVFPEQFRAGQAQHRFVVDLQFTPASS